MELPEPQTVKLVREDRMLVDGFTTPDAPTPILRRARGRPGSPVPFDLFENMEAVKIRCSGSKSIEDLQPAPGTRRCAADVGFTKNRGLAPAFESVIRLSQQQPQEG